MAYRYIRRLGLLVIRLIQPCHIGTVKHLVAKVITDFSMELFFVFLLVKRSQAQSEIAKDELALLFPPALPFRVLHDRAQTHRAASGLETLPHCHVKSLERIRQARCLAGMGIGVDGIIAQISAYQM